MGALEAARIRLPDDHGASDSNSKGGSGSTSKSEAASAASPEHDSTSLSNASPNRSFGDPRQRKNMTNTGRRNSTVYQQKDYMRRVKAAGQQRAWREVPRLLLEMRSLGIPRNVYVYNTAISALGRCRRPVEAEALLTAMLESDDVAPDVISYNSAINAYARGGDFDSARRLLERMRSLGSAAGLRPDVITFNTVADAAAKRGDAIAAGRVLAIMAEDGVRPDVITYNACLAACKPKGDLKRAVLLLELMRGDGVDPDQRSYSAVIATAGR